MTPFSITVCGIDELPGHNAAGVTHVLSILDPDHPVPDAFGAFGEHARLELRFHDVIEEKPGLVAPQPSDIASLLAFGRSLEREAPGRGHLLVHCHAGISRSSAAMTLILAEAMPERSAADVIAAVHNIREKAWPNLRMIELGDAMLERGGTLIAAAHALYRRQLEVRPHIAEYMIENGRGREVAAARGT